jgi:uncharacterized protein (TIGR04255 family)
MVRHKYNNPPIEEAICEFRFAPGAAWNLTVPGLFYEKVKDVYPGEPQQQNLIQAEFQIGQVPANPEIALKQATTRLLFQSADGKKLVGVGHDVLSIHSLQPYEGWEDFSQRINESFQAYLEVSKPVGVIRVAVRYINRIVISGNQDIELNDYFNVYPQYPDDIPVKMSGFLTRTESTYEDTPIGLKITLSDAIGSPSQAVFILDLEVFQDWVEKPLVIEELIDSLHELKYREGQVFEKLITDRTRELFDVVK